MRYDLNTDIDRERFRRRVETLFSKRGLVDLTEIKPKRTTSQNRYLHVILGEFAMRTGNTLDYVKREYFKRLCNGELFIQIKHDKLSNRDVEIIRSSRDLQTDEMTTAIERFRQWSAIEAGVDLPDAEDKQWIDFIEREMQHFKQWI